MFFVFPELDLPTSPETETRWRRADRTDLLPVRHALKRLFDESLCWILPLKIGAVLDKHLVTDEKTKENIAKVLLISQIESYESKHTYDTRC